MTDRYAYLDAGGDIRPYYDRQATAQTTIAPTGDVVRHAVQTATHIIVMITCVAVLITLGLGWHEYFQLAAAVQNMTQQLGN